MNPSPIRPPRRRVIPRRRHARMTDAEILSALVEVPREKYDPTLRAVADGAARDGNRITVYEAPALATPPALPPILLVVHGAPRPSMAAVRHAFLEMRARCAREKS